MVQPEPLAKPFLSGKSLYEPYPSSLAEQSAVAEFMASGGYERHLRRMKRIYNRKCALLQTLMAEHLSEWFEPVESDGGLHIYAWWRRSAEEFERYREACLREGVRWIVGRSYYVRHPVPMGLFGIARLSEAEITEGVRGMAAAAERC